MKEFVEDILGLRNDQTSASDDIDDVMNLVIKRYVMKPKQIKTSSPLTVFVMSLILLEFN
jgi:hypothetical protein